MEYQGVRNLLRKDQTYSGQASYGSISELYGSKKPNAVGMRSNASVDEFGDLELTNEKSTANKIMRTGRQRKKIASRSKGGEFQQRRKKRRVYFCCVSNEIDIEQFHDNFDKQEDQKWRSRMYEGVLHLYFSPAQTQILPIKERDNDNEGSPRGSGDYFQCSPDGYDAPLESYASNGGYPAYMRKRGSGNLPIISEEMDHHSTDFEMGSEVTREPPSHVSQSHCEMPENVTDAQTASMLVLSGGKEVFVFDFGAVVFWGFKHGEEEDLLEQIRYFVVKNW